MNRFHRQLALSAIAFATIGLPISCAKPASNDAPLAKETPSAWLKNDVLHVSATTAKLITVETVRPTEPASLGYVPAVGIATAFTDAKSMVNSRVRAKITSLPIPVGRSVTSGQIVAMLESEDLHNAQTSYRLAVERVKLAEAQLRRHKRLSILNSTTAQSLDAVIAEFDAAEANLAQGNIDLTLARAKVADLEAQLTQADIDKSAATRRLKFAETADSQAAALFADLLISRVDRDKASALLADAEDDVRLSTTSRSATLARLETSRLERDACIEKVKVLNCAVERTSKAVTRAKQVYSASTSMNKDVIEAQNKLDEARIEMESAADDIQLLGGKAGDNHTIFIGAPVSGVISEQHATVGNTVDMNTPILTIVDRNKVGITVNVRPADIANINIGSQIQVSPSTSSAFVSGAVMTIATQVDEATGLVPVRVQLPAGSDIRQGTMVNARIPLVTKKHGVAIPSSALLTTNVKAMVFIKTGTDMYQIKVVTVIQRSASGEVLVTGLDLNDLVVTTGANALLAAAESAGFKQ
ncbi:MAG: efflux RND transporter periplasmic adaptor subunit [Armatimonadota bacterium]